MSGELTPAPTLSARAGVDWRASIAGAAYTAVAFAVGGALAGVIWEARWTPPSGQAVGGVFYLDGLHGLPDAFSGTGQYVVVAAIAGLLLGIGAAFVPRDPRLIGVGVLVGSLLAAVLMAQVGHALGPPDPHALAKTLPDHSPLVADLTISGVSPYLTWPTASIVGFLVALMRPGTSEH